MGKNLSTNWTYSEQETSKKSKYVIRAGENEICEVRSVGVADQICRSRREITRLAMNNAFESRLHRTRVQCLCVDIRTLMSTLMHVSGVMKRDCRPREITAAREKVVKALREMKAKGHIV
jgi:hypothetical protein